MADTEQKYPVNDNMIKSYIMKFGLIGRVNPDYLVTRYPELTGHRIFGSSPTYNIHGGGGKSNNHLESYLNHPLDSQMVSYPVFNCCRTTPRALALQTWQTKLRVTDLNGSGSIPQDL